MNKSKKKYKNPIIFELGNVSDLTAGGRSMLSERIEDLCYDINNNVQAHAYTQPKG